MKCVKNIIFFRTFTKETYDSERSQRNYIVSQSLNNFHFLVWLKSKNRCQLQGKILRVFRPIDDFECVLNLRTDFRRLGSIPDPIICFRDFVLPRELERICSRELLEKSQNFHLFRKLATSR